MNKPRTIAAALVLSAAGLVGIAGDEWFTDKAVIPVKNDRPTIGFGSTFWEDGRPVKMGETITPVRALKVMEAHISREEAAFRKSLVGVKLHQEEYDGYFDFLYQFGMRNWTQSEMLSDLKKGDYVGACHALLQYRFVGRGADRYDCATMVNGRPNKRCYGVWTRQLARHKTCMSVQ